MGIGRMVWAGEPSCVLNPGDQRAGGTERYSTAVTLFVHTLRTHLLCSLPCLLLVLLGEHHVRAKW